VVIGIMSLLFNLH